MDPISEDDPLDSGEGADTPYFTPEGPGLGLGLLPQPPNPGSSTGDEDMTGGGDVIDIPEEEEYEEVEDYQVEDEEDDPKTEEDEGRLLNWVEGWWNMCMYDDCIGMFFVGLVSLQYVSTCKYLSLDLFWRLYEKKYKIIVKLKKHA